MGAGLRSCVLSLWLRRFIEPLADAAPFPDDDAVVRLVSTFSSTSVSNSDPAREFPAGRIGPSSTEAIARSEWRQGCAVLWTLVSLFVTIAFTRR